MDGALEKLLLCMNFIYLREKTRIFVPRMVKFYLLVSALDVKYRQAVEKAIGKSVPF